MQTERKADTVPQNEVDAIIYRLSHDLKASTRAVSELSIWLREDLDEMGMALPDGPANYLSMIGQHATRLDNMITGLLLHSRVARHPPERVCAAAIAERALKAIHPIPANLRSRLADATLLIAPADLELAVNALVSNAILHGGDAQGVTVCAGVRDSMWRLAVRDTGPGIPEKERERVRQPMVVLKSRDLCPTAGMGLAIVDKIATIYGGALEIGGHPRSTGTTVCLSFPLARP